MLDKAKNKLIIYAVSGALAFLVFFAPIITAAGVVAVPVVAIHQFFTGIGDFLFGNGEDNEVLVLIEQYLSSKEGVKIIQEIYTPVIQEETTIEVPLHWLIIPNLLSGIEDKDITKELVKSQIAQMKSAENTQKTVDTYINDLRKQEPWMSKFGAVSTTTIVGYINEFSNYLGQEGSLNTGNLSDKEFLYPLKTPAIVTSEFGGRNIGSVGGVSVNNHTGIDLAYAGGAPETCGVPVYASMSGEVTKTEATSSQAGANWGEISVSNVKLWYLHLRDPFPHAVGTQVKKGDFIGYIGTTGLSTACHLHFEIHVDGKAVNPRNFIDFNNPKIFGFLDVETKAIGLQIQPCQTKMDTSKEKRKET